MEIQTRLNIDGQMRHGRLLMSENIGSEEATERVRAVEHLRAGLEAEKVEEKEFHMREALQLLTLKDG